MADYQYCWDVSGVRFIWNGPQRDPEIYYKGKTVNYYTVEKHMESLFKEYCDANGLDSVVSRSTLFNEFCRKNATVLKEFILNLQSSEHECH